MLQPHSISDGYERFLKNRSFQAMVPLEAVPSLPVIFSHQNSICLSILFYLGKRLEGNDKIQLHRPVARILLSPISSRITAFIDYRFKDDFPDCDWKTPIGEFPHEPIATLNLKQYRDRKQSLIRKYDLAAAAIRGQSASAEWKATFKEEFYALCPPCLVPFLRKTGPSFFAWMDRATLN
jgi:hypothetical protein